MGVIRIREGGERGAGRGGNDSAEVRTTDGAVRVVERESRLQRER